VSKHRTSWGQKVITPKLYSKFEICLLPLFERMTFKEPRKEDCLILLFFFLCGLKFSLEQS
jgi:hypothetical protein